MEAIVQSTPAPGHCFCAKPALASLQWHWRERCATVTPKPTLGINAGDESDATGLPFFRSQLVLAARLASLPPPIDVASTALGDDAPVMRHAQAARRLRFGAKLCIHPRQVAAVNAGFTPSDAQVQ
jgi:citrate lyase beta subunit